MMGQGGGRAAPEELIDGARSCGDDLGGVREFSGERATLSEPLPEHMSAVVREPRDVKLEQRWDECIAGQRAAGRSARRWRIQLSARR